MSKQNKSNKPKESAPKAGQPAEARSSGKPEEGRKNEEMIDRINQRIAAANSGSSKQKSRCNGNALGWHTKEADLFRMATHISQFKIAGKQITPTSMPEALTVGNRLSVYEMAITPGTVIGTGDPYNKAIIDLFNRVRGKYTSTVPFQANDLGAVILAVACAISLVACTDRVLDNLGYVSYKSSLTPEILHAALVGDVTNATIKAGYDADVYQSPNLKLALEVQIRRLQGLFMPKMSLFDFAGWIFRHVYFEDPTGLRGDVTLFKPSYIVKYNPAVAVVGATGVYASGLDYRDINSYLSSPNPHDARIYLSALTDCIDALVQDDNVRTICGWLHQYMPDSPTIADLVQATRTLEPDQNPEMDLFIAGLTIIPDTNFQNTSVSQDVVNECLHFTMTTTSVFTQISNWLINYHKEPSDEEVGLSLIFTSLYKDGYLYSDPFVCTQQRIYRRTVAGVMDVVATERRFNIGAVNTANLISCHEGMNPTSVLFTTNAGGTPTAVSLFADCEYQVRITPDNAYNVHYASIASLMKVDGAAKSDK